MGRESPKERAHRRQTNSYVTCRVTSKQGYIWCREQDSIPKFTAQSRAEFNLKNPRHNHEQNSTLKTFSTIAPRKTSQPKNLFSSIKVESINHASKQNFRSNGIKRRWSFFPSLLNLYINADSLISWKYNHYHVVLLARISLTLSRYFSLSFIGSGRSSGLHLVSSHSCCMYVRGGRI